MKQNFSLDTALTGALQQNAPLKSNELDGVVRASLYRRQAALANGQNRRISLWWLPMTVNFFVCGVPAVLFALPGMPTVAHIAAFAFGWLAFGGITLTLVGLRFSGLKEQLTLTLPTKRINKEAL